MSQTNSGLGSFVPTGNKSKWINTRNIVEIKGAKELEKLLKELPIKLQKKAMKTALKKSAVPIRNQAAINAPRGKTKHKGSSLEYGHLADNIVIGLPKIYPDGNGSIGVGPETAQFWGYFLEFGTGHQDVQEWLSPALEKTYPESIKIMQDELWDYLKKQRTSVQLSLPF